MPSGLGIGVPGSLYQRAAMSLSRPASTEIRGVTPGTVTPYEAGETPSATR